MRSTIRSAGLLVAALVACTSSEPPRKVAAADAPPASSAQAPTTPTPPPGTPPAPAPSDNPPAPASIEPPAAPADPASVFAASVATLVAGDGPSRESDTQAWADYRAGRFRDAQRGFARVALADPQPWKHPYNLACAAARAGDDAMVRVGLREAVRRGGAAAANRARRDPDLESLRGAPWFEPVLRGESVEPIPPAPAAPAADAPVVAPPAASPAGPPAEKPADLPAAATPDTPAKPPAPAAATPPPPAVPPPPEPAALPGAARAVRAGVTKPEKAALEAALTAHHGVKVAVRKTIALPTDAGAREAWVVYEFSKWKKCMATGDKKSCRAQLAPPTPDERNEALCTAQWIVRATLGEAVTLSEPAALQPGCKLSRVHTLEALDLDADGADEILVDVTGQGSYETMREGTGYEVGRIVRVLRRDGSVQLDLWYEDFYTEYMPTPLTAYHFYLTDTDGDARPDLVVQERDIDNEIFHEGMTWPSRDDVDDPEKLGPVTTKTWRYDPTADAWPGGMWRRR